MSSFENKKNQTNPKIALVTGAAKRIGREIATHLAENGFDLALHCYSSLSEAEALRDELRQKGVRAAVYVAELSDKAALEAMMMAAHDELGPVSLLVNSASTFEFDEIGALDSKVWDRHMAVNLEAPVFLAQAFSRQAPEGASIINIIDQRVWKLTPQFFSYTLSKAALWTATQTLAQALAPKIRVNAIGPGPTLASHRQSAADFAAQAQHVPLQRAVSPRDVAAAVLFLAQASAVTGQMIAVDSGQHLAWQTPDVSAGAE